MAQIYILPFLSDNRLIVKKVHPEIVYVPGTVGSLEMIKIQVPAPVTPIAPLITAELNKFGIIYEPSRSSQCIIRDRDTIYIYKTNTQPNNLGIIFNVPVAAGANITDINESALIFQNGTLLPGIITCRNAATPVPTPSDDDSNINIIIRRPFWPPILGPFSPYGFWPYSPTVRISTPYSSPIVRIPFFSLPRPDFGFVPAVVPTVTQPVLSPFMGNPFPRRVSEPSPMNRHLFDEKIRPVHMRSKRLGMNGGYYAKYLKYKNKYLELKNQLENQV